MLYNVTKTPAAKFKAWLKDTAKMVLACAVVGVVFFSMVLFLHPGRAEELLETEVVTLGSEEGNLNGEPVWIVSFEHEGKILSWFDDEFIEEGRHYRVLIFGDMVIYAEKIEEPPQGGSFFLF